MSEPEEIIRQFANMNIVLVGDLVADQFLHGKIERVSREAPVFILEHEFTDTSPGGAANAAANIASLGGKPKLVGVVGSDRNGSLLMERLEQSDVNTDLVVTSGTVDTTTKIRVLAGQDYAPRQQVIRIDYKNRAGLSETIVQKLLANLRIASAEADAIVISDYNYGVADVEIAGLARSIAAERGIPLLIDSRFRLSEFTDATSATPNQEEVEQALGKNFTPAECEGLREKLRYEALLVTRGNKGMLLCEKGKQPLEIGPVGSIEPVDVTGAGDTVIAVYSLGLACGLDFETSARVANHAGGIVVMKKGTCSVTASELLNSLSSRSTSKQAV